LTLKIYEVNTTKSQQSSGKYCVHFKMTSYRATTTAEDGHTDVVSGSGGVIVTYYADKPTGFSREDPCEDRALKYDIVLRRKKSLRTRCTGFVDISKIRGSGIPGDEAVKAILAEHDLVGMVISDQSAGSIGFRTDPVSGGLPTSPTPGKFAVRVAGYTEMINRTGGPVSAGDFIKVTVPTKTIRSAYHVAPPLGGGTHKKLGIECVKSEKYALSRVTSSAEFRDALANVIFGVFDVSRRARVSGIVGGAAMSIESISGAVQGAFSVLAEPEDASRPRELVDSIETLSMAVRDLSRIAAMSSDPGSDPAIIGKVLRGSASGQTMHVKLTF
jgi:hypothetical protein